MIGHGIGLRPKHFDEVLEACPDVGLFEATTESYLVPRSAASRVLERVRRERPVVLHGVSMAIGSIEPPPVEYLAALRGLIDRIEPALVSDHLCWGRSGGKYAHDLLPLPLTEEAIAHVAQRIRAVQEALGRQILIENVSSYLTFDG
mgnify:CR=1 FL=1